MNINLSGRTALITGASRGIGKKIAYSLGKAGARVIICSRSQSKLHQTEDEFKKSEIEILAYSTDATNPRQVKSLLNKIKAAGSLDILINNVGGVPTFGDLFSLTDKDWQDVFDLNFFSMVYFCRESIPLLKKSKHARIINIATVPARQPGNFNPHYNAAKSSMVNLNKYLANVLSKNQILVNAILPGSIKGDDYEKRIQDRAERDGISLEKAREKMLLEDTQKIPLGRLGEAEDVASLTLFLASDYAQYITGAVFNVDGGATKSAF